jgi:hypothetical protein
MRAPARVASAALVVAPCALALGVSLLAQAPKAMMGTWTLNVAKSTFSPGPAPKSMSITYAPEGEALKIVVDLVPAEGEAQHWEMTAGYDGKGHPVVGNPDADMITLKRIDALHGQSTFSKSGKVMAVNKRTLSADGKTLTIATTGTTSKGQPRKDVAVYER